MAAFHPLSSISSQADPAQLLEAGNEHVWFHSSSWRALASQEGKRIMVEGRGCIVKDIDGKEYIDGLAGLWLVNVGHGRKEIGEAMAAQAGHAGLRQLGADDHGSGDSTRHAVGQDYAGRSLHGVFL